MSTSKELLAADTSVEQSHYKTLHKAALAGCLKSVSSLLSTSKANINEQDRFGRTALCVAIYAKRVDIAEFLLADPNIDINVTTTHTGEAAVHYAARADCLASLRLLLTSDALKINKQNKLGQTALHLAACAKHADAVKLLISVPRIEINLTDGEGGTVLHDAACAGCIASIGMLIKNRDLQINKQNEDGQTALHLAACTGHADAVKLLLSDPNIEINLTDVYGNTALYEAAFSGCVAAVRHLIEIDTLDINQQNKSSDSPLHVAARTEQTAIVELLSVDPRIKINITDVCGSTALHDAAGVGCLAAVEVLLTNRSLAINQQDDHGRTALHVATYGEHHDVVALLSSEPRIKIALTDMHDATALHMAMRCKRKGSVLHDRMRSVLPLLRRYDMDDIANKEDNAGKDSNSNAAFDYVARRFCRHPNPDNLSKLLVYAQLSIRALESIIQVIVKDAKDWQTIALVKNKQLALNEKTSSLCCLLANSPRMVRSLIHVECQIMIPHEITNLVYKFCSIEYPQQTPQHQQQEQSTKVKLSI